MNKENLNLLLNHLQTMQIGFVAINGYTNAKGEISDRRINIGFSYESAKKRDLQLLINGVAYIPSAENKYSKADWDIAILELKASLAKNNTDQEHINRSEGQKNAYLTMTENGAVQYNFETTELYVYGIQLKGSKEVIEAGDYKEVKSSAKTLAKNAFKKTYLKTGLIRRFIATNINQVKLKGDTIELSE